MYLPSSAADAEFSYASYSSSGSSVISSSSSSSSSSSAVFSSCSSSSSSVSVIKWIDPSNQKKWDYDVWKLGLFLRSEQPASGKKYKVKCRVCEERRTPYEIDYAGTTNLCYHAKSRHKDLQQVKAWMAGKEEKDEKSWEAKAAQNNALIQVCLTVLALFSLALQCHCLVYVAFSVRFFV